MALGLRLALNLLVNPFFGAGGPAAADTWQAPGGAFWELPGASGFWELPA